MSSELRCIRLPARAPKRRPGKVTGRSGSVRNVTTRLVARSRSSQRLGGGRLGSLSVVRADLPMLGEKSRATVLLVTATQPQASQAISRSAAFTVLRMRAASPAGRSCSSNSRTAQRSEGRSQRRPQTPHDATPGLSSANSASSRRFALPQATPPTLPPAREIARSGLGGGVITFRTVPTHPARASCPLASRSRSTTVSGV